MFIKIYRRVKALVVIAILADVVYNNVETRRWRKQFNKIINKDNSRNSQAL